MSQYSNTLWITTGEANAPGGVSTFHVSKISASSCFLEWGAPLQTGAGKIAGYLVYQRSIDNNRNALIYNGTNNDFQTSLFVMDLLADTRYLFSVVSINEYGVRSAEDLNLIQVHSKPATVPSAPSELIAVNVLGGSMDMKYRSPDDTGGFSAGILEYIIGLKWLNTCYNVKDGCYGCSHYTTNTMIEVASNNSCSPVPCSDMEGNGWCCFSKGNSCGVLHTDFIPCLSGECRLEGLNASTVYGIRLAAKNPIGIGSFSDELFQMTR
jgi:hypothetical protein